MCEGEPGGGTIVCQHDFHFLTKNPVQALQFHLATMDPYFLWYKAFSIVFNVSINVVF